MQIPTEGLTIRETAGRTDEPEWIAAARHGEPQALECLFRAYRRPIYSLCYRLLARAEDAEDATQATFVGAFRALGKFNRRSSLKTWLYRIAVNESLNILRQRERRNLPLHSEWPGVDAVPEIVQRAAVAQILGCMRPEQRLILVLFYWEDLSCGEIADVLAVSQSAVKMRLKRAREEFERQYGGEV